MSIAQPHGVLKEASTDVDVGVGATTIVEATTILVVDDDPVIRRITRAILSRENYEVQMAADGQEALECVGDYRPDLMVLDYMMPRMDGLEVCRRLRADCANDDMPIIFLTSKSGSQDKAAGFSVGGADYVTKPVDSVEFLARVRTHLELAQSRRVLRRQAKQLEGVVADQSGRLEQVRSGQESLLAYPADFSDANVAVRFIPAFEAGGDFYDIVRLGDDGYGFMVADVAGHDLGTAYLTGALKALTVSFANEAMSVEDTMLMMNSSLSRFLDAGQYATACYVKYCRSDRTIDVINGGHPNPVLQVSNECARPLELVGDVLGIHETVTCKSARIKIDSGDRLFIYTDGLTEGYPDEQGKRGSRSFGMERLTDAITERAGLSLEDTVNAVVDGLLAQCGGRVGDDVVLLGIEF